MRRRTGTQRQVPESDSQQAVGIGEEITEEPKKRIFRFNPGKELKVFPDKHPYNKAPEAAKDRRKLAEETKDPEQAVRFIQEQEDRGHGSSADLRLWK